MRCVLHRSSPADLATGARLVLRWLDADPVLNSLQAGVLRGVLAGLYPVDQSVLAHVEDGDTVLGVAVRTPGRRLILSAMPPPAAVTVSEALGGLGRELPGVLGPVQATDAFAREWSGRTGCRVQLTMAQRVHRLDRVILPGGVPGHLGNAEATELDLICDWAEAFSAEVGADPRDSGPRLREQLGERIAQDRMPVWRVDGSAVSMAGPSVPTAGVVRIGFVYTPPEHRGHGYAAACVAAESQRALDRAAIACSLITDQANRTSNRVYARIGYYPIGDVQELTFSS